MKTSPRSDLVERIGHQTKTCVLLWWVLTFIWFSVGILLAAGLSSLPSAPRAAEISLILDWESSGPAGLTQSVVCCGLVILVCFVLSHLTGNVSQVDKLWSLVPVLYTAIFAANSFHPRLVLMLFAVGVWGGRLTFNFWRRGGYAWPPWRGEEDYRWAYVRQWPVLNTSLGWFLFNLLFISFYQHCLLLALALPALPAALACTDLTPLDWAATLTILILVAFEYFADQQQFDFQTEKWRRINAGVELEPPFSVGFVTWGLYSRCRHPNYLAEQLIWVVFYVFSVSATGQWINFSLVGSLLLISLFQGSTMLSESITSNKYHGYKNYQQAVPIFGFNFWSSGQSYEGGPKQD